MDEDSAVIGLPNEIQFPIAADHRAMCRFSARQSQKYLPVEQAVLELVQSMTLLPSLARTPGKVTLQYSEGYLALIVHLSNDLGEPIASDESKSGTSNQSSMAYSNTQATSVSSL